MDNSLLSLHDFIRDFNLQQLNGTICFKAKIEFHINEDIETKESEVHIITSDNLAAVYFLSLDINNKDLPDMFNLKNAGFTFDQDKCLKIKSGIYTVYIFPQQNGGIY